MTWAAFREFITRRKFVLGLYTALALAASGQQLTSAARSTRTEPPLHRYNNYVIFERSWDHLVSGQDLYALHPQEHWDLFKYTPTFAVLMAPFSAMPDAVGLPMWNLLNALVLVLAVSRLPMLDQRQQAIALLICAVECMTALQNAQSNGLVVGLLVLAFAEMERGKSWLPALCVLLSAFIKLFGIVGLAMFLMHDNRWKLAGWTAGIGLILTALPLLVISPDHYAWLFESYGQMLSQDHSASLGYSLHGILHSWFGLGVSKSLVLAVGSVLFMLPVLYWRKWTDQAHRLQVLCLILWWVLVFNHKSESPTFVIAMAGVGVWFVHAKRTRLNLGMMWFALVLTSLVTTDLCPRWVREQFVNPYALKALPIVVLWAVVMWRTLTVSSSPPSAG